MEAHEWVYDKLFLSDLDRVKYISEVTISDIYPHYYPKGAVDFFLGHHNEDNILSDIENQKILEEVVYSICLSVEDNYDVEQVAFYVGEEEIYKSVLKTIE